MRSNGIGVLVREKNYSETFLYVTLPPTADLAILEKGTFMAYSFDTAKRLCELNSLCIGYAAEWICKKKEHGRLTARCCALCFPASSSGQGIRERGYKSVNYPAFGNTINAENVLDEEDLITLMTCHADPSNPLDDNEDYSFQIISVVTSFD